jgi:hypothetical protein
MRRSLRFQVASCLFAGMTVVAAGADDTRSPIVVSPIASPQRVEPDAAAIDVENTPCVPAGSACHQSHSCGRKCEAGRYRSNIPRGHCVAIAYGLREVGDIAVDVPYSFYEWAKKIKNTILDRGTCRDSQCSH